MSNNISSAAKSLLSVQLFRGLEPEVEEMLLCRGNIVMLKKREHLFLAGNRVDYLYFLISGKLKEYYCDSGGSEFLRRIVLPQDIISVYCLCHPVKLHSSSCCALCRSTVFSLPLAEFEPLVQKNIRLCLNLAAVASRQSELTCRNNCLCRKRQAKARVAGYLLSKVQSDLAGADSPLASHTAVVDLRPLSLSADEICLARETFSRILVEFERDDLVTNNRGFITIHDQHGLMSIAVIE